MISRQNKLDYLFYNLIFYALAALSLFLFTSLSGSALFHILILPPALYWIIQKIKNSSLNFSKSSFFLLLFIFTGICSALFSPATKNLLKSILNHKYYLFGILTIYPLTVFLQENSSAKIRKLIILFFVSLTIANLSGLIALFTDFNHVGFKKSVESVRAPGLYGQAITYGYGISYACTLLLGFLFLKTPQKLNIPKKLFYLCLLTSLLGLYFSYSRGALLGFLFSFPFYFINSKKKLYASLVVITSTLAILLIVIFNGTSTNRFLMKAKSDSNMIRLSQYQAAFKAFQERPLLGYGLRTFDHEVLRIKKQYHISYQKFSGHAHNNYLQVLAGTGILGFIFFCLFLFYWGREIFQIQSHYRLFFIAFFVNLLVSGLFQNTMTDGENMFFIMFMYSLSQFFNNKELQ